MISLEDAHCLNSTWTEIAFSRGGAAARSRVGHVRVGFALLVSINQVGDMDLQAVFGTDETSLVDETANEPGIIGRRNYAHSGRSCGI